MAELPQGAADFIGQRFLSGQILHEWRHVYFLGVEQTIPFNKLREVFRIDMCQDGLASKKKKLVLHRSEIINGTQNVFQVFNLHPSPSSLTSCLTREWI